MLRFDNIWHNKEWDKHTNMKFKHEDLGRLNENLSNSSTI